MSSRSPFKNFNRTTTGRKIYHTEAKAGPLPPSKVNELTLNSKTRQKILYRADNGVPLPKANKVETFVPPNNSNAK